MHDATKIILTLLGIFLVIITGSSLNWFTFSDFLAIASLLVGAYLLIAFIKTS